MLELLKSYHFDRILKVMRFLTLSIIVISHVQVNATSHSQTTGVLQQLTITGTVIDADGFPLPGVNVVIKGSMQGTVTDVNGAYTLQVPDGNSTLVFSFVGFVTQEILVGSQRTINVTLGEDASEIEEVVVIGYGSRKKESLTGGISVVNTDVLKNNPVANIGQALQGAAPGIDVRSGNVPGGGATIRIHGRGTINNNDPLWVVDGVPGITFNQINPSDIENISILKDAASTAIYGSRGANGVILVTTKQGKKDQPVSLQFSSRFGINRNVAKFDLLNVEEYGEMLWLQAKNSGIQPNHAVYGNGEYPVVPRYLLPAGANDVDLSLYDIVNFPITETNPEGTNWHDVLFREALTQEYNLSMTGSSKNTVFSVGMGYLDEPGIVKSSNFERYTLTVNVNTKVTNWLEIGESTRIANSTTSGWRATGESGAIGALQQLAAILPVYDVMGNYAPVSRLNGFDPLTNPYGDLKRAEDFTSNRLLINGNVNANITFLKDFSFKTLFGYNIYQDSNKEPLEANPESYQARADHQLTRSTDKTHQWNWVNTLDYITTLADIHTINVLLGTEAINRKSESFSATRTGFLLTTEDYWVLNAGEKTQTNSGSESEWATFSMFGRIHYAFDNKYLLDASLRRDGSSRFGKNNRYGYFPSAGVGWRISEEMFMDASKNWLSSLKLRASWGQSGNDAIGNYNGFTTFGTSVSLATYPITGADDRVSTGFQSTAFGNPNAKWEKTISNTIGVDAVLFSNLNFMFDFWQRNTKEMLYQVPIPNVVGDATAPSVNIGEMKNVGFDIQVGYRGTTIKNNLGYWVTLNLSHYRNELIKLSGAENEVILGGQIRNQRYIQSEVGTSFPEFYGYKVLGIFQTEEEAAAYPQAFGTDYNKPGRFKFADVNDDGIIDSEDRTYIGNPHPGLISNLTFGMRYKQFDLNATFYSSLGNDIVNVSRRNLDFNMFMWNRSKRRLYESWGSSYLKNNLDAKMPIAETNDTYSQQPSSYFVEDGSYLRLENLTLGYALPSRLTNRLGLQNVRLYVMGSNLFTVTKYSGLDPSINTSDGAYGIDHGLWPTPRRYMVGIDITLGAR